MIKVDNNLLQEIGLGNLSDDEKNDAIDKIMQSLEERVGDRLIDQMDGPQMDNFEQHLKEGDTDKTMEWLKNTFPNQQQVVEEELAKIKDLVKAGGLASLASSV